jgi:hypothetical protein
VERASASCHINHLDGHSPVAVALPFDQRIVNIQ